MLPPDPALALPEPVLALLAGALEAQGPLLVPRMAGVPHGVLVRWLHRRWVAARGAFAPLVQLADPPGHALDEVCALAEGGWLDAPGLPPGVPPNVRPVQEGGPTAGIAESLARRMVELDALHLVASDPGLEAVRRSLGAHGRTGTSVHLAGPPGSGRASLVRLAWMEHGGGAALDDAAVGSPAPEAWGVFREPGALEADRLAALRRRLRPDPPRLAPRDEAAPPRPALPAFDAIVGESPAIRRALSDAARFARSSAAVLLVGEPGVGKEVFARALHVASGRRGPLEAIDVSALPRDLVESELFGHVRGAFTGATADRPGAFRRAEGGTLLLDELGNLDLAVQAKLLRVLQERAVRPVGGERTLPVDVRVIAATNADLDAMVARGAFRLDLLHRLNALVLRIPPLRDRGDDILLLARGFLAQARGDTAPVGITPAAAARLLAWPWNGNVRELWGVMERAAAFSEPGEPLDARHLDRLVAGRGPTFVMGEPGDLPVAVRLEVPRLRARGPRSIRHAVLTLARGRRVDADALAVLESLPWEGELVALRAAMDALLDAGEGPIDRAALSRVLGHLLPSTDRTVFVDLLQHGEGFTRAFPGGVVVVGRARGWEDLSGGVVDRRGAARVATLRALVGAEEAEFLPVPTEAALSRAHLVIRRVGAGLEIAPLPDASAPATARPPGGAEEALPPGRFARYGEALEVSVRLDRDGVRRLRFGVYAGAGARARHAGPAADDPDRLAVQAETGLASSPGEPAAARVWALTPEERALLNGVVLAFHEGDFSAHLRRALLARSGDPAAARLQAYLLRVRPTQYCARLYEFEPNAPLVGELSARLGGRDRAAWLRSLPGQLASVLEERLPPG